VIAVLHFCKLLVNVFRTLMVTLLPQQASNADGGSKPHWLPHSTVLSCAQLICGGVVSCVVTVWLHVLVLPQQSVATHVRVMTCAHGLFGFELVTVLSTSIVTFGQQASNAAGLSNVH